MWHLLTPCRHRGGSDTQVTHQWTTQKGLGERSLRLLFRALRLQQAASCLAKAMPALLGVLAMSTPEQLDWHEHSVTGRGVQRIMHCVTCGNMCATSGSLPDLAFAACNRHCQQHYLRATRTPGTNPNTAGVPTTPPTHKRASHEPCTHAVGALLPPTKLPSRCRHAVPVLARGNTVHLETRCRHRVIRRPRTCRTLATCEIAFAGSGCAAVLLCATLYHAVTVEGSISPL